MTVKRQLYIYLQAYNTRLTTFLRSFDASGSIFIKEFTFLIFLKQYTDLDNTRQLIRQVHHKVFEVLLRFLSGKGNKSTLLEVNLTLQEVILLIEHLFTFNNS